MKHFKKGILVSLVLICAGVAFYSNSQKKMAQAESDREFPVIHRTASKPRVDAEPAEIRPEIKKILQNPNNPDAIEISSLSDAEVKAVIDAYQKIPALEDKMGLVLALALSKNQAAASFLQDRIANEFAGKPISKEAETRFLALIEAFGFLARDFDSAYLFLKDHTIERVWLENPSFAGSRPLDAHVETWMNYSFAALGASGRDTVMNEILENGKRFNKDERLRFGPGISIAAYNFEARRRMPEDQFRRYVLFKVQDHFTDYANWSKRKEAQWIRSWSETGSTESLDRYLEAIRK